MGKKKKQIPVRVSQAEAQVKDFFDMVSPATMKFNADHFVCGDTYRCVWAVREYPPQTSDQAIFSQEISPNSLTNYETSCIIITYQDKLSRNMAR